MLRSVVVIAGVVLAGVWAINSVEPGAARYPLVSSAHAETAPTAPARTEEERPRPTSGAFDPATIRATVAPRIDAGKADIVAQTLEAYYKAAEDVPLGYASQRAVFALFAVSSPDVDRMTAAWLKAEPESAYALTARGWYLWHMAWLMRGEGFGSDTYPEALSRAKAMFEEAARDGEKAYAKMPDLIGASDLLIQTAMHVPVSPSVPEIVASVMKVKPNRGTLALAAVAMGPKWLGQGRIDDVFALCQLHAGEVPDVANYTVDVCKADLLFTSDTTADQRAIAAHTLATSKSWVLDAAKAEWAMVTNNQSDEARRALEIYLFDQDVTDTRAAQYLDDVFYVSEKRPLTSFDVFSRRVARAGEKLKRDPYNLRLIEETALELPQRPGANRRVLAGVWSEKERFAALRAALDAAPFDPRLWADLGDLASTEGQGDYTLRSPFYRNAVAYSNQQAFYAGDYANNLAQEQAMSESGLDLAHQCDFVRAVQVYALQCPYGVDGTTNCGMTFDVESWMATLAQLNDNGACKAEFTASPAASAFKPEQIDWSKFGG